MNSYDTGKFFKSVPEIIMVAIAFSITLQTMAQRIYYDAILDDLKGDVKSCTTTTVSPEGRKQDAGAISYFNRDGSRVDTETEYDSKGLPIIMPYKELHDTVHWEYKQLNEPENGAVLNVTERTKFFGSTIQGFDKEGNIVYKNHKDVYNILYTYQILNRDNHGNWTRRKVFSQSSEQDQPKYVYDEVREITYWDGNFPDLTIFDVLNAVKPTGRTTRELTIRDMLYRPFGIVDIPAGKVVWDIPCKYAVDVASQQFNYEVRNLGFSITIFGNRNNGTNRVYNRTFKGEPVFSTEINETYDGKISEYSISFLRGIKGEVPRKLQHDRENVLKQSQWTKEEAISFAEQIVAEVEAAGLPMKKVKGVDGHIFSMGAKDKNAFYYVAVTETDDDLSAFYSVSLAAHPLDYFLNTLHSH